MKFLLLDKSDAGSKALALLIRSCLDSPIDEKSVFYEYKPEVVLETALPKDLDAAFITISNTEDVESVTRFSNLYKDIPLIAVSRGGDYSVDAYRSGARYYIKRPMAETEIREALRHCVIRGPAEDGGSVP